MSESSTLASILFKEYRRKVLGLLLLHPDQSYYVREIARITGTVAGTLHKELSKLADSGLLIKNHAGNQVRYQANKDCVVYQELASILRKTSGLADVLLNALAPVADNIQLATVFGSIASGKATHNSDIDLLVVGDLSFSELVQLLHPTQQVLGREINPKLYSHEEWLEEINHNNAFVRELLTKPIIYVIGDMDDFRKHAGYQS